MNCPHCCGVEKTFGKGLAEHDLHDYQAHGPSKTTRLLIEALKAAGIEGLRLLDIGGGVGVVQHELLAAGVSSAISVEASSAYLQVAQRESERQGHAGRITYYHGDFVDLAPQLPQADIVTLDRVICCYPHMQALVGLSAARAAKFYGVVFPRDTGWMKAGGWLVNLLLRLQHNAFRAFVHPTTEVEAVVRANGLERRYYRKTFLWQVLVYARSMGGTNGLT
jgi:2-polyprenyl-3-methyl-5-hydroxy-6-metoxy-1,4-benzoquinol methylase